MKTFIGLAKSRRSIREYDGSRIERTDLESMIEAARYAPSACNSQPWRFIIVDDPSKKKTLAKEALSGLHSMNSFAHDASAYIVILSDRIKPFAWLGQKIKNTDFRRMDIGIACSHLILQAQDIGIGTCNSY